MISKHMKHKITEIKNRAAYIEDCLVQLRGVIEELEAEAIDKALNTSKEMGVNKTFLADGTANEIDDECEGKKLKCLPVLITGTISLFILLAILLASQ
jgi:hypothetical protein